MPDDDEPQDLYGSLAGIVPPRDIDLPEREDEFGGYPVGGSLRKRMNESPKMTDMQSALKTLFPGVVIAEQIIEWITNIQVSRVFPDTYVPYRNMIAKHLIQTNDEMSLVEAFSIADRVLSIAIDGEGRIDVLALIGKTGEAQADDKKVL